MVEKTESVKKSVKDSEASEKSWLTTLLLLIFLSGFHRAYVGKIGTCLLYIITFGGLGIWWLIDLITLLSGSFTDKSGKFVKERPFKY